MERSQQSHEVADSKSGGRLRRAGHYLAGVLSRALFAKEAERRDRKLMEMAASDAEQNRLSESAQTPPAHRPGLRPVHEELRGGAFSSRNRSEHPVTLPGILRKVDGTPAIRVEGADKTPPPWAVVSGETQTTDNGGRAAGPNVTLPGRTAFPVGEVTDQAPSSLKGDTGWIPGQQEARPGVLEHDNPLSPTNPVQPPQDPWRQ